MQFSTFFSMVTILVELRAGVSTDGKRAADGIDGLIFDVYLSVLRFVARDIIVQGVQKILRVLGRHHNASVDAGFRDARQNARKIHNKFRRRVRDNRQIRIYTFGFFFAKLDIDIHRLVLRCVVHNGVVNKVQEKLKRQYTHYRAKKSLFWRGKYTRAGRGGN